MKIGILRKELVNYQSEFEFFSKVIENYEKEFENMRKMNGKNMEQPSDTIFKIVKLLQHKTERTTMIFNDMLAICQKEISYDLEKREENNYLFTQLLEEFSNYFETVSRKATNLKLRIKDLKQKAFGMSEQKQTRIVYNNPIKIEKDQVFRYQDQVDKKRGLKNLEGILVNFDN